MESAQIKKVGKGCFIKLAQTDTAPVWVRGAYDRQSKSFSIYRFDDICHERFIRGDRLVFVGFTF